MQAVFLQLSTMPQNTNSDVVAIRKWLTKEPYLPKDIDDFMLKKFLHSCYGSLERTKQCIERFCTTRTIMHEIYTCKDPASPKLQTAFSISYVTTYPAGEYEVLIHQLNDPNLDKYSFYDALKSFAVQADFWLRTYDSFPEGHIIIMDIKDFSLKLVAKSNIMYFRDFLLYLLEGMPVRVQQIHIVNCPSYYEKLFALVKPVLPKEICDLIHTHGDPTGLHKHIDKKHLPAEFGGDAQSIKEQQEHWVKEIVQDRDVYTDENMWKADIKKKPKNAPEVNTMNGSFRTLSID